MYKIIGYCRDCTGYDPMGCNDGEPFDLGEVETIEEARKICNYHKNDTSSYYANIFDKDGKLLETI